MVVVNTALARDELLSRFTQGLVTRTLAHVAEEARLDGESLKEAVERYEIDYAWHVLAADRTRDAVLAAVEARLGRAVSDAQRANLVEVLQSASTAQPTDALMSFDNDVAELLGGLLCAGVDRQAAPAAQAA
jgi:hypothetical protein